MGNLKNGIPDMDITREEAISLLRDILIQCPLIALTKLGKALILSIEALKERK